MKRKKLLVPLPLVMHTKLKWAARQEGTSMSRIVRGLIQSYLDGNLEPTPTAMPRQSSQKNDFYNELASMVDDAIA